MSCLYGTIKWFLANIEKLSCVIRSLKMKIGLDPNFINFDGLVHFQSGLFHYEVTFPHTPIVPMLILECNPSLYATQDFILLNKCESDMLSECKEAEGGKSQNQIGKV